MRIQLYIFLLFLLVAGCKKYEIPAEHTGTPQFYFIGDLDDVPIEFYGGDDGFYHAPSQAMNDVQLFQFTSAFVHQEAGINPERVQIIVNDDHISNNGKSSVLGLLNTNGIHFNENNTEEFYAVQFEPIWVGNPVSFVWDFGDGETSTEVSPVHHYTNTSIKKYLVCVDVLFANGCNSQLCSEVAMPDAPCSGDFTAQRKVDSLTGEYWDFRGVALAGTEPFSYFWIFENNVSGQSSHIWYQYVLPPQDGTELTCLDIVDAEGCLSTICKNVVVDSNAALCAINFDYKTTRVERTDSVNFGRVNVVYTDPSGMEYSTSNVEQPTWARFHISEVKPYPVTFNGESTIEASIDLTCVLGTTSGEIMTLRNGHAIMAFPSGSD